MKTIYLALFSFIVAVTAYAQERVILDSETVYAKGENAILVRTPKTPKKVKVIMQVQMGNTVCDSWGTRMESITSGSRCGYNTQVISTPITTQVCAARNPYNNVCLRMETRTTYSNTTVTTPRSCMWPTSFCERYSAHMTLKPDGVVLKFKNASKLIDGQEETISIAARQANIDYQNVSYELNVLSAIKEYDIIKRGFLGSDVFDIQGI